MNTLSTNRNVLARADYWLALVVRVASRFLIVALLAVPMVAVCLPGGNAAPITVVVFSDRSMAPILWNAVLGALSSERLYGEDTSVPLRPLRIVRGDEMALGIEVESSITVYLHGDCNLTVRTALNPPHHIAGALGWVERAHGQILPFVNVDCSLIGDLLRSRPAFLAALPDPAERYRVMSRAIARVVLHEYLHIANQSSAHARHGIAKSEFSVEDLIAPAPLTVATTERTQSPLTTAGRATGR